MSSIKVNVLCDWPEKKVSMTIDASSTLAQIQVAASKALDMQSSTLSQYRFSFATYGTDVVELSEKEEKAKLVDGSCVFAAAPGDLKPQRKSRKKKVEEKEEKFSSSLMDQYKGLTSGNVIDKWTAGKSPKDQKVALEYIDMFTDEIVKTSAWLKLSKQQMSTLLARDGLSCDEHVLFDALLNWGKAEAKRQKVDSSDKEEMKKLLAELHVLIRYPCMEVKAVAMAVTPSGFLESQQTLDLFTYLASSQFSKGGKVPDSLKKFKATPRVPRKKPGWKLSTTTVPAGQVTFSENNMIATKGQTGHCAMTGEEALPLNRISKWKVHITRLEATQWLMVGIVQHGLPLDQNSYTNATNYGLSSAGQRYAGGANASGFTFTTGDVLECTYDPKAASFTMNCSSGRTDTWPLPSSSTIFTPHFNIHTANNVFRVEPM
jgi:hypothetical protein